LTILTDSKQVPLQEALDKVSLLMSGGTRAHTVLYQRQEFNLLPLVGGDVDGSRGIRPTDKVTASAAAAVGCVRWSRLCDWLEGKRKLNGGD